MLYLVNKATENMVFKYEEALKNSRLDQQENQLLNVLVTPNILTMISYICRESRSCRD